MSTMTLTPQEAAMIKDELKADKSIVAVARSFGFPIALLRPLAAEVSRERAGAVAREDIAQYAIATKPVDAEWPDMPEIAQARLDYEAGKIELVTGYAYTSDGRRAYPRMATLYAIPRKTVRPPNPWFTRIEE